MTSPTPSECINFLIFLVHLILLIVNKLYDECKLMFIFICSFNYSCTCSLHDKPHSPSVRLTTTLIKHCAGHRPLQFLYQSTHRHPFITGGIFPECHTSIYMVKHQICTRVEHTVVVHYIHSLCIPACTSLTRELWVRVLLTLTLRPHGCAPTRETYQFKTLS